MKRINFFSIVFILIFLFLCNGRQIIAVENAKIIKASAQSMPEWVLKKKKSADFVYFVGMSTKAPDLKQAKKEAVDDAASQLVEYIGFRATTRFKSTKEMTDMDNVSSFKETVQQTIDGKGTANVNIDLEDIYYEQYSDNTYSVYCLIKFPQDWVEKERKRLQKLVNDQRQQSQTYLSEADDSLKTGNLSKSLDLSLNALLISEKAAENSDIYDQSKNSILMCLSSLSFALEGAPKYAYIEGGGDPIQIKAMSSKTSGAVAGLMMIVLEENTNAVINSKIGNTTDDKGKVVYNTEKIADTSADKLDLFSSFSLAKFDQVKKIDEEFYNQIEGLQKSQALNFSLSVVSKDKALNTAIVVFDIIREGKQKAHSGLSLKFQEAVSGKMANSGFNIISAEIPPDVITEGKDEGKIKQAIMKYLKSNYPDLKRLLLGIRQINYLGEIGKDIVFKEYNINDSEFKAVEVKFILSFIDIDSNKTEKGVTIEARGMGLNEEQAVEMAAKKILEKMNQEIEKFN